MSKREADRGRFISVYDSSSEMYSKAFRVFLTHTDQKQKSRAWIRQRVTFLESRRTFIDAGAGNGTVTEWICDEFQNCIAIEPNKSLYAELREACPRATLLPCTILDADIHDPADFILSSHVFYYIDETLWLANVERLASWLSDEGVLVLILQSATTDCMKMLERFIGKSYNIALLGEKFRDTRNEEFEIVIQDEPATVCTSTFAEAYCIAEFMLNLVTIDQPPERCVLEDYVRKQFKSSDGQYRFSVDQCYVLIQRKTQR